MEAMAAHLIDSPVIGWELLGHDLIDGAPDDVRAAVIGEWGEYPSKQFNPAKIITFDGRPPAKDVVTQEWGEDIQWVYVLHQHGVEVISRDYYERGPVVPWDTDPTLDFTDYAGLWAPDQPLTRLMPKSAAAAARATSGPIRSVTASAISSEPVPSAKASKAATRTR